MLEVLFFSLSISIDAFGYALGFGSKKTRITKKDFFVLDLINNVILLILIKVFYLIYNYFMMYNELLHLLTSHLLICFGLYYMISSFLKFKSCKKDLQKELNSNATAKYFTVSDFLFMLIIFLLENTFSAFVFIVDFSNLLLFLSSNFFFHYLFFLIGFNLGERIVKKVNIDTSFVSGLIFALLGLKEFF